MSEPASGPRLRRELGRLLRTRRLEVEAGGREGEIAVLRVPPEIVSRLLAPEIRCAVVQSARSAGYRWAALELWTEDALLHSADPGRENAPA